MKCSIIVSGIDVVISRCERGRMIRFQKKATAYIAAVLIAAICMSGCQEYEDNSQPVKAGQTISSDSKWINSDIDGAIDEKTETDIKDDFYTAVNSEWILKTKLGDDDLSVSGFSGCESVLEKRELDILRKSRDDIVDTLDSDVIDPALLTHDRELVSDFTRLSADWNDRNDAGIAPAKPYIDAITKIDSIDEMSDYLLDKDGTNFTLDYFIPFGVMSPLQNGDTNTVFISTCRSLSLMSQDEYSDISSDGRFYKSCRDQKTEYVLEKLGYSADQTDKILRGCYRIETRLAQSSKSYSEQNNIEYIKDADNSFSFAQIGEMEGSYPLTDQLKAYGLDVSKSFTVAEPDYVTAVGKLYNKKNLEDIKDFYIVHTASEMMPLLDREAYDRSSDIDDKQAEKEEKDKDPDKSPVSPIPENDNNDDANKILLDDFITPYMSGPLDQIYVAESCTSDQKEKLEELTDSILKYYRQMLMDEEWMSDESKKTTVDKLNNISIRILYPEKFCDYAGLEIDRNGSLVDAVAAVNRFSISGNAEKVNKKVDKNEWNFEEMPTTVVNAMYNPTDNSINVLAGIIADGSLFNENMTDEAMYARIGAIIGHEITHAFDGSGFHFDKNGHYSAKGFWDDADTTEFEKREKKMGDFYSALTPYPGAIIYNGSSVEGEATADMGGIKCMLALAKNENNFNYKEFFMEYAKMWRTKNKYEYEEAVASDVHPLSFLRVNVTVQQFDEFYKSFDIKPGDGMYVSPEKRIAVW